MVLVEICHFCTFSIIWYHRTNIMVWYTCMSSNSPGMKEKGRSVMSGATVHSKRYNLIKAHHKARLTRFAGHCCQSKSQPEQRGNMYTYMYITLPYVLSKEAQYVLDFKLRGIPCPSVGDSSTRL